MCRPCRQRKNHGGDGKRLEQSRGTTPSGRISSAAPTHAITTAAAKAAASGVANGTPD